MKPAKFDYIRVTKSDEAVQLLAEHGESARVIAGGQSLMAMLNMRLTRPSVLIDISAVEDLSSIQETDKEVAVGAAVTQASLLEWEGLNTSLPLLAKAMPNIGHFQTRNRGTVCGSLCHSDPSSELPLCLALLKGEIELRSTRGSRRLSASEFQIGTLTVAKEADELVTRTIFPSAELGAKYAFDEFNMRHGDFAIVAVGAMRKGNTIRLAVGGVADTPTVRTWEGLVGSEIDDALNDFAWDLGASADIHSSARHRRELVRTLGRKVIEETS